MSQNLLETLKNSPWNDSLVKEAKGLGLIENNILTENGLLDLLDQKLEVPEVTEDECQRWWDNRPWLKLRNPSVHASHILFAINENTPVEPLVKRAEVVLSQLRYKINLEPHNTKELLMETAMEFSNCPSSERGGDLGTISPEDLAPEMVDAFFRNEVLGLQGELLKSRHGFHLVFIHERFNEGTVTYEESLDKIKSLLSESAYETALRLYLNNLSK